MKYLYIFLTLLVSACSDAPNGLSTLKSNVDSISITVIISHQAHSKTLFTRRLGDLYAAIDKDMNGHLNTLSVLVIRNNKSIVLFHVPGATSPPIPEFTDFLLNDSDEVCFLGGLP
jgi:hypothetical protein